MLARRSQAGHCGGSADKEHDSWSSWNGCRPARRRLAGPGCQQLDDSSGESGLGFVEAEGRRNLRPHQACPGGIGQPLPRGECVEKQECTNQVSKIHARTRRGHRRHISLSARAREPGTARSGSNRAPVPRMLGGCRRETAGSSRQWYSLMRISSVEGGSGSTGRKLPARVGDLSRI